MKFSHRVVTHGDITIIYCRGPIVLGDTEELRKSVLNAIERTGRVVLQLAEVDYVDSTGLGLLAYFCSSARKRSGDVKLVAPTPEVAEVLELTMLGRLFHVFDSEDHAVAAFAGVRAATNG